MKKLMKKNNIILIISFLIMLSNIFSISTEYILDKKNEKILKKYLVLFNESPSNQIYFNKLKEILIKEDDFSQLIFIYEKHINNLSDNKKKFIIDVDFLELKIWNQSIDWEEYLDTLINNYVTKNNEINTLDIKKRVKYIVYKLIKNDKVIEAYSVTKNVRKFLNIKFNDKYKSFLARDFISIFTKNKDYKSAINEAILFAIDNKNSRIYKIENEIFSLLSQVFNQSQKNNFYLPISNKQFFNNIFFNYKFNKTYNDSNLNFIIKSYEKLIENNISIDKALLKIAEINYEVYNDLDKSILNYKNIRASNKNKKIIAECLIKEIEILTKKGDLESAYKLLDKNTKLLDSKNILFLSTQLFFYMGDYKNMNVNLDSLIKKINIEEVDYNDILEIKNTSIIFAENQEDYLKYSNIQHKIKMHKLSEASLGLIQLMNSDNFIISNLAQFQYGLILLEQSNIEDARKIFTSINGNTIFYELAMLVNLEIEDHIYNNYEESINLYEDFLINFPNSIYQENILKRLNYLIKEKMES